MPDNFTCQGERALVCYYISGYDLLSRRVYLLSYEIYKPLLIRQVRSTEINTLRLNKSSNHFHCYKPIESCCALLYYFIRMLGFVIQVIIYILRSDQEQLRKMQHKVLW